jgi:hypothetical protein
MKRSLPLLATLALAGACGEANDPTQLESVAAAFQSVPVGFENTQSSFAGAALGDNTWMPEGRDRSGHGHGGPGRGKGFGFGFHFFMGGGLHGLFIGDGFGPGFGRGRGEPGLIGVCTFDASSGRIHCDPLTHRGLTVTRSAAYLDADGNSQSVFDTLTTNSVNVRVAVTGTLTRRRDSATSVVDGASDRTVTGLAPSSPARTVNGASRGRETISGADSTGAYTAERVAGDTVTNVVIPKPGAGDGPRYPTAGTVIRSMQVTLSRAGESPVVSSRREVITYDGSSTARIVITHDGATRNCTMPLPRGRLSCS